MPNDPIAHYFSQFPTRLYKKHLSIVNPGDSLQTIYYLKKGYVRLYSVSGEGKELTFIIYKPGEFFPFIVALAPYPYPYWIETMTNAEIIPIPVTTFNSFFKEHPHLLLDLSTEIVKRLDKMLQRMEYLAFGNKEAKMASILLILAQRFGEKENNNTILQIPLTHKELASLVGLTRETTSSIMSSFLKKGYVGYNGRNIVIKNMNGLRKESLLNL